MVEALESTEASVVASFALAGGALTAKYEDGATGRLSGALDAPRTARALAVGRRLRSLAEELDTTPARLGLAFALANPGVASVLFGATSAAQVADDVGAVEVAARLSADELARLRELAR